MKTITILFVLTLVVNSSLSGHLWRKPFRENYVISLKNGLTVTTTTNKLIIQSPENNEDPNGLSYRQLKGQVIYSSSTSKALLILLFTFVALSAMVYNV